VADCAWRGALAREIITGMHTVDFCLLMVFKHQCPYQEHQWREQEPMALLSDKPIQVIAAKTAPKQIPLFEEQEDGNLVPYDRT